MIEGHMIEERKKVNLRSVVKKPERIEIGVQGEHQDPIVAGFRVLEERVSFIRIIALGSWAAMALGVSSIIAVALWTRGSAAEEVEKALKPVESKIGVMQRDLEKQEEAVRADIGEQLDAQKESREFFTSRHEEAKLRGERLEGKIDALMMYFITRDKEVLQDAAVSPKPTTSTPSSVGE